MNNVSIDVSQIKNLFAKLDEHSRQTILFQALKKGAEVLQENTKTQLFSSSLNSSSMQKGIKLKADKVYNEVSVNIMGDYRLKWFEKGTKPRKTKNKSYRGQIKPLYFFKRARQSNIENVIMQSITDSLK